MLKNKKGKFGLLFAVYLAILSLGFLIFEISFFLSSQEEGLLSDKILLSQVASVGSAFLPKTPSCGDNMCNARSEDHWSCPSDCKGPYFIVDKNNSACTNNGSVAGAGTAEKPFCDTLAPENAGKLTPGATVYIKGGRQSVTATNMLQTSGTADAYITYRNYPGETPIMELGRKFDTTWTPQTSMNDSMYDFYKSDKPITDFGWETSATKGDRLIGLTFDGRNPLSTLLTLNDLQSRKFIYPDGERIQFDGFNVVCNSGADYGKMYISVRKGLNPNSTASYFTTYDRFNIYGASYVRFIGLDFRYGREAIKISNDTRASPQKVPTHIEMYDNVFSGFAMPIGDHPDGGVSSQNIIDSNRFLNNSRQLVVNANSNSSNSHYLCESEVLALGGTWEYEWGKWDHVMYGESNDIRFSNNYVDGGNNRSVVALVGGEYFNNHIKNADFYGSGTHTSLLFYNNIIENPNYNAIGSNSSYNFQGSMEFYNNIFVSGWPNGFVLYGRPPVDGLKFKNNIVIRGELATNNRFCFNLAENYKYSNRPDANNNIYIGCDTWYMSDGKSGGGAVSSRTLADWSTFLGGGDSASFVDTAVFDVNGYSDIWSTLTSRYADKIFDKGQCLLQVTTDKDGKARPRNGCDIGPYENNSDPDATPTPTPSVTPTPTPEPIHGLCGATNNSCTSGTLSDTTDSATNYLWSCNGSNGGNNASCTLPKNPNTPLNGSCGTTNNSCTAGTLSDSTDSSSHYLWSCVGLQGGTTASCQLVKPNPTPTITPTPTPNRPRPTPVYIVPNFKPDPKDYPQLVIPITDVDATLPGAPSWLDIIKIFFTEIATKIKTGVVSTYETIYTSVGL